MRIPSGCTGIKRYFYILIILFIVAGIREIQHESQFLTESFINAESLDLTEKYVTYTNTDKNRRVFRFKKPDVLLALVSIKSVNPVCSFLYETLSYAGEFCPYTSIYTLFPLRSPPDLHVVHSMGLVHNMDATTLSL